MSDDQRRRGGLTPEQREERFSTGGLDFEESLRRILAGGPDDENPEEEMMGEHSGVAESDVIRRLLSAKEAIAEIRAGTRPVFYDLESVEKYWASRHK